MDLVTEAQCEAEIVYLRKLVDAYRRALGKQEPVAYILFAENGNVRMFSRDRETAGPDAVPVYLHQGSDTDRKRMDFLAAEATHDSVHALFRQNRPITRPAVDAAMAANAKYLALLCCRMERSPAV